MQDCSNSIANALELLKSCTKPLRCPIACFWRQYLEMSFSIHLPYSTIVPKCHFGTCSTWNCCYFDQIFFTGCPGSCQNDNFRCSQWWKFYQDDRHFHLRECTILCYWAKLHFLPDCYNMVNMCVSDGWHIANCVMGTNLQSPLNFKC